MYKEKEELNHLVRHSITAKIKAAKWVLVGKNSFCGNLPFLNTMSGLPHFWHCNLTHSLPAVSETAPIK